MRSMFAAPFVAIMGLTITAWYIVTMPFSWLARLCVDTILLIHGDDKKKMPTKKTEFFRRVSLWIDGKCERCGHQIR